MRQRKKQKFRIGSLLQVVNTSAKYMILDIEKSNDFYNSFIEIFLLRNSEKLTFVGHHVLDDKVLIY